MPGWKKILCPVDFSDTSRVALNEALELAQRNDAMVVLLHVLEDPAGSSRGDLLSPPEMFEGLTRAAQSELAAWKADAEKVRPGRVVAEMVGGRPATEAVRVAAEGGFDLVVLGTHGRRGLRRLALGSVAEETVRTAPCPVLVVRPRPGGLFQVEPD